MKLALNCYVFFSVLTITYGADLTDLKSQFNELVTLGKYDGAERLLRKTLETGSLSVNEENETRTVYEMLRDWRQKKSSSREKAEDTSKSRPAYIEAIGGYSNAWFVSVSSQTRWTGQTWIVSRSWPRDWIKERWEEGYWITGVSGDQNSWFVVVSKDAGRRPDQAYSAIGPLDETWIAEKSNEGYRITAVGGWLEQWVVVLTKDTGWGQQRFTRPGDYKKEWVESRWQEGYSITSLAGDVTERNGGSFVIVMTKDTGWERNAVWTGTADEFSLKVPEFRDAGYSVTGFAPWGKWCMVSLATNVGRGANFGWSIGSVEKLKPWIQNMWDGEY